MDTSISTKTEIPFKEEDVRGPDGKKIGVSKTWFNDTGAPVELNPPGIVIQPKHGLRIDASGSVTMLPEPKVAPKLAAAPTPKTTPAPAPKPAGK